MCRRLLCEMLLRCVRGVQRSSARRAAQPQVMGVQTLSAVCAGLTSSVFTNPLDVIKTRLQVVQTPLVKQTVVFSA